MSPFNQIFIYFQAGSVLTEFAFFDVKRMKSNLQLDLACRYVEQTDRNIFLTGKAGTGKTTFLKSLKASLHKRFVILAPTGIAALNAEGQTIHSFFQFSFAPYVPGCKMEQKRFRKEKINIIQIGRAHV